MEKVIGSRQYIGRSVCYSFNFGGRNYTLSTINGFYNTVDEALDTLPSYGKKGLVIKLKDTSLVAVLYSGDMVKILDGNEEERAIDIKKDNLQLEWEKLIEEQKAAIMQYSCYLGETYKQRLLHSLDDKEKVLDELNELAKEERKLKIKQENIAMDERKLHM